MKILAINSKLKIYKDFIDYPYYLNINLYIICGALLNCKKDVELDIFDSFSIVNSNNFNQIGDFYYFGGDFIKQNYNKNYDYILVNFSEYIMYYKENIDYINNIISQYKSSKIIFLNYYSGGFCFLNYSEERLKRKGLIFDYLLNGNFFYELGKILNISLEKIFLNFYSLLYDKISLLSYQTFLKKISDIGLFDFYKISSFSLPYYTSRGCVFNCNFCTSTNKIVKGYEEKEVCKIEEEIVFLKREYNLKKLIILDALFNKDKIKTKELLDLFIKYEINIEIPNGVRIDLLDEIIIKKLSALLTALSFSVESGDKYVNRNIVGKGLNFKKVIENIELCKKYGIKLLAHFIIGFPGETKAQINNTLEFAYKLFLKYDVYPAIQLATAISGTRLFDEVGQKDIFYNLFEKFQTDYLISSKNFTKNEILVFKENFYKKISLSRIKKLIVNLTYLCMNNCIFCAIGDRGKFSQNYLLVVKELIKYYKNGVKLLDLDGGEPTLYPNLNKVIKIARKIGYKINLTSSGRKFKDINFLKEVLSLGLDNLLISLHGSKEEIHDLITNRKGSFKETVEGLDNILDLRKKYDFGFGINVTLCKINQDDFEDYLDFITRWKPDVVNIQFLTPFGTANGSSIEQNTKLCCKILKTKIKTLPYKVQLINLPFCFMKGFEEYVIGDINKMERDMMFVGSDTENLYNYLSSRRYRKEECNSCIYKIICDGFYEF